MVVVLGAVIMIARIPLRRFYRAVREPFLIAFSTASSEAALPLALENMEQFGVPKHIVGFVHAHRLQLQSGRHHAVSLAGVGVRGAGRGVHLSFGQQLVMMLTLMLTSKGVAGVPRAALVILAGTLATSTCRWKASRCCWASMRCWIWRALRSTCSGNCLASAVVARWEGFKVG